MTKATPMIFNTEMVRALLTGNKTQTRRPVADWQLPKDTDPQGEYNSLKYMSVAQRGKYGYGLFGSTAEKAMNNYNDEYNCENPFGRIGSLIYVRETFTKAYVNCWSAPKVINPNEKEEAAFFKAGWDRSHPTWKSSIHMPRWASRLTLKITNVRVERIQDITKQDAEKKGFKLPPAKDQGFAIGARTNFIKAWQDIYTGSWSKNEWVWVIDFEVIHKNIDLVLKEMKQVA